MSVGTYIRGGLLIFIAGAAMILIVAGTFADSIRTRLVFRPHEESAEQAVHQLTDRQRALRASSGSYAEFSNADVDNNAALLGLSWRSFPVNEYFFDASVLDSGHVRLRALPRPDAVAALAIRARLYIAELSEKGEIVRSGWYPSKD